MVYPITLLSSWILKAILDRVEKRNFYVSNILIKRFIPDYGPSKTSVKCMPLVRILKFYPTNSKGELITIVNDSKHKIAAVFSRNAICKFEVTYGQRLTFKSVHSLVIVRQAGLRFMDNATFSNFRPMLNAISMSSLKGTPIVYLEINEVDFFLRDAHTVSPNADNTLKFIYTMPEYHAAFGIVEAPSPSKPRHSVCETNITVPVHENWGIDSDGMISEEEDEESSSKLLSPVNQHTATYSNALASS